MLNRLVGERAKTMYAEAAQKVTEKAIEECQKLGLGHSAHKEMINYAVSDEPIVPHTAQSAIMQQIVSSIEIQLGEPQGTNDGQKKKQEGGKLPTAEELKKMEIQEIRELCDGRDIRTVDEEGKKIAKGKLIAALLLEPLNEQKE